MQLSFSIDAILGTAGPKRSEERIVTKQTTSLGCMENNRANSVSPSTHVKEEPTSPRSHTIEWKPPSADKSQTESRNGQWHTKNDSRHELAKESQKIFHSPPNAHVVTNREWDSHYSLITGHKMGISTAHRDTKNDLKMLQTSMFASRYLPYPSETLRSHRVNHHPHHYPYSLPFLHPAHDVHTVPSPGVFSPHFANNGIFNVSPTAYQDTARVKSASPYSSGSDAPASTRPSSTSSSESERSNQSPVYSDKSTSPSKKHQLSDTAASELKESSNSGENEDFELNEDNRERKTSGKRGKRVGRRLFTGFQILELEKTFALKPYLTRMERAYISQKVNLTECQIKTWFQNRRTKAKRRGNGSEEEEVMAHGVGSSIVRYSNRPIRIPGYGIQLAPTYGPPDQHLQAAIVDYLRRRSSGELISTE